VLEPDEFQAAATFRRAGRPVKQLKGQEVPMSTEAPRLARVASVPPNPRSGEFPSKHKKVGAYRVLGEIGRGGMAQVWRGVHETLQREVAIKELLPESVKDKEALSRFRREALALAAFRHENIVTLYDLVEKNESLFMILEYVNGPTLAQLLKEGPVPPDVAAVIGVQLASALDHAHFSRIIHRDIKPANIMITKSGEVKLMDFGIAKDEGLEALTREGIAVGTPSYMSPEQVMGGQLDPRTDIFSLGVVLYECLTGNRPFVGQTAGEVFARIRDGKYKSVIKANPRVPATLEHVVKRAMKVKLNERYFDAAEMRRDLERFLVKHVSMSHAAMLVAFLRHRNKISETEALARLTNRELAIVETFERLERPRRGKLRWVIAAVAVAGAALYFTQQAWLPMLSQLGR
jgi:eukaryotic-like serine/threonine-protein kinase